MKTSNSNKKALNKKSKSSKQNGLHKEYFTDGKLSMIGKYIDGKRNGTWKFYLRNGNPLQIGKFENSK